MNQQKVNSLVEINSFKNCNIRAQNAVLCLIVNDSVLTVTEKRGTVGFPGGRIERNDATVFDAMKREYSEETGNKLPKLSNIRRFIYNGHTAIYVATTNEEVPTKLGHRSDGEIIAINFLKIADIKKAINDQVQFKLRNCVKRSTKLLFDRLNV